MLIIIGEVGKSKTIDALIKAKKIDGNQSKEKMKIHHSKYQQSISRRFEAIVIAGSDKRGTIYGITKCLSK
jgi:hypothetical protein